MLFLTILRVQFEYEKYLKIWKSKMAAACVVIYVAVIAIQTKYTLCGFD